MDWIRKNPMIAGAGLLAVVGLGVWWYHSREESFSERRKRQIKERAKKIGKGVGKLAGRVGDIGLQVVDDRYGTTFKKAAASYGGVYGAFADALRS